MRYRNLMTGRVLERPSTDEWLDASSGWERVEDELAPEAKADDNDKEETE